MSIGAFLTTDHRRCDELFFGAEEAAADGDWDRARHGLAAFERALLAHFSMEEQVMFPAFEARTGMSAGPTMIMRSEHAEMRELLGQMNAAVAALRRDECLGIAETLLTLMQQHNVKEEQILYRMADQALAEETGELLTRMRLIAGPASGEA